jgi:hypothetical protein
MFAGTRMAGAPLMFAHGLPVYPVGQLVCPKLTPSHRTAHERFAIVREQDDDESSEFRG